MTSRLTLFGSLQAVLLLFSIVDLSFVSAGVVGHPDDHVHHPDVDTHVPTHVLPYSATHPTNLSKEIKDLESYVFAHISFKPFTDGDPLHERDIICNCTIRGCDAEINGIMGMPGLCRAREGVCTRRTRRIYDGKGGETIEDVMDCLHKDQLDPPERPFRCESQKHIETVSCCNESLCTQHMSLEPPPSIDPHGPLNPVTTPPPAIFTMNGLVIFFLVTMLVLCAVMGSFLWLYVKNEKFRTRAKSWYMICRSTMGRGGTLVPHDDERPMLETQATLSTLLRDLESTNSGSGSGLPLLIQRTIALQIELKTDIGQGRFGEVKLGIWRGENVAVKIFSSRDERSWNREVEIYNTHWLRHSNILQFIASDKKDTGVALELWLITEYHPFGSLYDYLQQESVDECIAVQLIRSFANGMQFLHSEIPGQHNKPAIAHRDVKSKNILVRRDLTCVIADLGLAVRFENGELNIPDNNKCGTARYLSPELLDDSMVERRFESYRMADMYSFGLVMWEIARRTRTPTDDPTDFEQSIPYYEYVPRDPSVEDMHKIVVCDHRRPSASKWWNKSPILDELYRVMAECWRGTPSSRLTAMNVRMALDRLARIHQLQLLT